MIHHQLNIVIKTFCDEMKLDMVIVFLDQEEKGHNRMVVRIETNELKCLKAEVTYMLPYLVLPILFVATPFGQS